MAEISRLLRLVNGVSRNVDLASNTIVVSDIKVGGASGTVLSKAILDKLVLVQNQADADGSFDSQYSAIGHNHAGVYEPADATILKESEIVDNLTSTSTTAPLSANQGKALKDQLDAVTDDQTAAEVSYSNASSGLSATDVQAAIDEVEGRVDSAETTISSNTSAAASAQSAIDSHVDGAASKHDASEVDVEAVDGNYHGAEDLETVVGKLDQQIKDNATAIGTISGAGMFLAGGLDASSLGAQLDDAAKGATYNVTGAGTIFSTNPISLNVGDQLICNVAQSGTPDDGADWSKIDNTESSDILRSGDIGSSVASQAAVVSAQSDATQALADAATADGKAVAAQSNIDTHEALTNNPHSVSKAQVLAAESIVNADVDASAAIAESKLALDFGTSALNTAIGLKQDASANLDEADTFFGSTDLSAAEAEQLSDGSNADSLHKHSKLFQSFTNNSGVAIAAGDVVALDSVSGQIIVADASAIASCDAIVGIAAEAIANTASGNVQIYGQATVSKNVGESFTPGQRVFASEAAGEGTQTAPSASLSIIFLLGYATSADSVMLNMNFIAENE